MRPLEFSSKHAKSFQCMRRLCLALLFLTVVVLGIGIAAQEQSPQAQTPPANGSTTRTVQAVGYIVGSGGTKVDLVGTNLMPAARGEAKVEIKSKAGRANIKVNAKGLSLPSTLGAEFLTYVVWVVTPEGRTGNTGELLIDKNGDGELSATTPAQAFSIIISAEPYFAVRVPSEMVILQSQPRKDTKGKLFPISEYKLMKRAQYQKMGNPLALTLDPSVPLQLYEARNAVEVARSRAADKYAPEIFSKAEGGLKMAEAYLARKSDKSLLVSTAQQTAQFAEDARALSVQRQEAERVEMERQRAVAAAKAEAEARAAAEAAEAKRIADERAAEAKREADAKAAEAKREADAQIAAKEDARRRAEEQKKAAEREKQELRARLLEQFNRVLPTTDTDRGLVVNMGDVLFDSGKTDLRSEAREALAKLSGIVLNYPSLRLGIEGHTDSTGSAEFNQTLSEKRAEAVLNYLLSQGLDPSSLSAIGFGMTRPVEENSTPTGRQKNRRVEIIVSGEVIGTEIGKS